MTIDPQMVLLATTVAGFIVQAWRESRNRKWAAEDRSAATKEIIAQAAAEAEATRIKTEAIADKLKMEALLEAARLRAELVATASHVRLEAEVAAGKVREEQHHQAVMLSKQLTEVQADARGAYNAANHSAEKLAVVNDHMAKLSERLVTQQQETNTALVDAHGIGEATLTTTREVKATTEKIDAKLPEPVP